MQLKPNYNQRRIISLIFLIIQNHTLNPIKVDHQGQCTCRQLLQRVLLKLKLKTKMLLKKRKGQQRNPRRPIQKEIQPAKTLLQRCSLIKLNKFKALILMHNHKSNKHKYSKTVPLKYNRNSLKCINRQVVQLLNHKIYSLKHQ